MRECDVNSPAKALEYIVDCTLATVESMAMTKSRKKREYQRQISIAQKGVDWLVGFWVQSYTTRVADVVECGWSVEKWAKQFEV